MALNTRDRQQLYTRLAPVIGEEEAETLLDQFPSRADAELVTMADLKAVEARLDHRIDLLEQRVEAMIQRAVRRIMAWTIVTAIAILTLADRLDIFG